ncbi:MAG TPA: N-acetyltransferase family protein [Coleofasciculaceae cyanobacterium]
MQIRDAVEADLPAIVSIYNAAIPSQIVTADIEPVTVEQRLSWFYSHTPNHRPLWLAEQDQEVLGWLGFQSVYGGRPAYNGTAELSIYIAPQHQRQGVGHQLLQSALERSPDLQIQTLLGLIFSDNLASLRLFERFQFEQWGYLPRVAAFDRAEQDLVIVGRRVF